MLTAWRIPPPSTASRPTRRTVEAIVAIEITGPVLDPAGEEWLAPFLRRLVEDRLVACGSMMTAGVRSIYRWEGEVNDEPELLVTLHTREALVPAVLERTDAEHPYDVPGFRYHPLQASPAYHRWVIDSTGPHRPG
jgi:periplasmic divalent cation tolerance protein